MLQPFNPSKLTENYSPDAIKQILRTRGCDGCELGLQNNFEGPVIYRGNPKSGRMIIGEAPGLKEDIKGIPFCGPAGELNDKIFASVGWSIEHDWLISNVVWCRPVAQPGSGKQNLTPTVAQRKACKPYITQMIKWVDPRIIVLLGASAAKSLLPGLTKGKSMGELAGKIYHSQEFSKPLFYIMYHPAFLLHSQSQPEKYESYRKLMWDHIRTLKKIVQEIE